ncbi:GFA family protein [Patulibacter sp.]|uniref:GFA family protein n=1 Tax=Patulibacter sp. TaxID=1912859 RepID=UPI0027223E01|nr:GFA family protein [Patulibacter sp.]MDO9407421.1 GFA family protein [Patulibacter sp.]
MSRTGRCVCGTISYEVEADPIVVALCHCDDCQRQSGAAFSTNLLFPKDAVTVAGTPTVFHTTGTGTGEDRERSFCGTCGSVLFTQLAEQPGVTIVKAGTLDDRTGFAPAVEVWTDSAQEWVAAIESGRPTYPQDLPAG